MKRAFIIAEAGINHGGDIDKAKELALRAKESWADAVKFQSYTTENRVNEENPAYDILKQCELSFEQQLELINYTREIGIEFMSTPFDVSQLDFLLQNNVRKIKVSSFDVTNKTFLKQINDRAKEKKDISVTMSVGMANYNEIEEAIRCLSNVSNITVLYCVSAYPVQDQNDLNLDGINKLNKYFGHLVKVGYSNHHKSSKIPALTALLGVSSIECHFMIDTECVDAPVSLDPEMFLDMVKEVREFEAIMGIGKFGVKDVELGSTIFRRKSGI